MLVRGQKLRSLMLEEDGWALRIVDQRRLPRELVTVRLETVEQVAAAIRGRALRGPVLCAVAAAYGVALAMRKDPDYTALEEACGTLRQARPTAASLRMALDMMRQRLGPLEPGLRERAAFILAGQLCDDEIASTLTIGMNGLQAIGEAATERRRGQTVNILLRGDAGWLTGIDLGPVSAAVYLCHDGGLPVHVWVAETRPLLDGSKLLAWELAEHGVAHTIIADNAAPHLMQQGHIDMVLAGAEAITSDGDVCARIGTYGTALAARDCGIPFLVASPSSGIDFRLEDGPGSFIFEERPGEEVTRVIGEGGEIISVVPASGTRLVANPAHDVTPARLVTGLITERGVIDANRDAITRAFPERVGRPG
ncbi:s-methyl-5-thioribose-1-phosphate isomerase [Roseibium aestuarii]|uniref:S-methyl-5-thioribose-1-phosphate isomerase n=1 Tax=Roseibium aestuarii TaxID=2600299 RepID=A0ABW4JXU4_9HYPH|nr:s-methyl-5-thioribose-1-phosphate isomerase [Roseibium aestuarii]